MSRNRLPMKQKTRPLRSLLMKWAGFSICGGSPNVEAVRIFEVTVWSTGPVKAGPFAYFISTILRTCVNVPAVSLQK